MTLAWFNTAEYSAMNAIKCEKYISVMCQLFLCRCWHDANMLNIEANFVADLKKGHIVYNVTNSILSKLLMCLCFNK